MVLVDSIQTTTTVVKRTIQRSTKRIVSISNIITVYKPISQTNLSDTSVKIDTTIKTNIKEIIDSLIIPDSSVRIDTNVIKMVIPIDSLLSKDSSLSIDTLKNSRASYSIDTMVYKDSTVHSDTVKSLIVKPDSIMVPVTYYDFHSDGSKMVFEGPCAGIECREVPSDVIQMAPLIKEIIAFCESKYIHKSI